MKPALPAVVQTRPTCWKDEPIKRKSPASRLPGSVSLHEGNQWQAAQCKARGIEKVGADVFHADALSDESETPDQSGEQEQQFGA